MNTRDYHSIAMVLQAFDDLAYTSHKKSHCHPPMGMPLEEGITALTGLSTDQLNALFQRWAGVNLTCFMQGLTLNHTRKKLLETRNLLAASLPGTGTQQAFRICCQVKTMPSAQKKELENGEKSPGMTIEYGVYPSPFGNCLLAIAGGICHLSFVDGENRHIHLQELRHKWPQATIIAETGGKNSRLVEQIFTPTKDDFLDPLTVLLKGTPLQLQVWQALLTLPKGAMTCYQDLAALVGHPTASRAVAGAVAANPVGYLIPCHRVIRKSGEIHHYRWGSVRKKAMLGWKACEL